MDLKAASDEELVLAFQQKDLQALEEFFGHHHGIALAVAYRVLGDREIAEDVLQEAFLPVWRQADTYQPEKGKAVPGFSAL
jgi:RNA polymerase sigma-70 factor, ECF subfamily